MSPVLRQVCRAVLGSLLLWLAALLLICAPHVQAQASGPVLTPPVLKAMIGGQGHTCVLTAAGGVQCWGDNQDGLLGNGTTISSWAAVDVIGLDSGVQAIAADWLQTCALTAAGRVLCWGARMLTPTAVAGLGSGVRAVDVNGPNACAVTAEGEVKCWHLFQPPATVAGLTGSIQAVALGESHTCALTDAGGVQCWGENYAGQLGDGTTNTRAEPVAVAGLASGVQAIAAGSSYTCALTSGGRVKCWGSNNFGELGADAPLSAHSSTPLDVAGLDTGVQQIVAGWAHTCALLAGKGGRRVECWGANHSGALGDGTLIHRSTPVEVIGLDDDILAIGAGSDHACALRAGGGARCWGRNWSGQLGSGSSLWQLLPAPVVNLPADVQALAAGENHTCLLSGEAPAAGGVQCWGSNEDGQLGDGSLINRYQPAAVSGLAAGVRAIAAGNKHTCALSTAGGVQCWGSNATGQLGDGTELPSAVPVSVIGLGSGVQAIAAGKGHTCAVTGSGGVQCWGDNKGGQLGDGTQLNSKLPVDVVGLSSGVRAVAAGLGVTCALTEDGSVQCWGAGRVGDGTRDQRTQPVKVVGLERGVQAVTAGNWHMCALLENGGVQCWGDNQFGQLGDGTRRENLVPVDVVRLGSGVQAIEAGGDQTCAVRVDGSVHCWGANRLNVWDLDDGLIRTVPTQVGSLPGRSQSATTGGGHTCVLTADGGSAGAVQCWGFNFYGQVGVNPGWSPLEVTALLPRALFAPVVRQ